MKNGLFFVDVVLWAWGVLQATSYFSRLVNNIGYTVPMQQPKEAMKLPTELARDQLRVVCGDR